MLPKCNIIKNNNLTSMTVVLVIKFLFKLWQFRCTVLIPPGMITIFQKIHIKMLSFLQSMYVCEIFGEECVCGRV